MKQSYNINLTKVLGTVLHVGLLEKDVSKPESVCIFRWIGEMVIQLCWACLKEETHYPVPMDKLWGSFKQAQHSTITIRISLRITEQQLKLSSLSHKWTDKELQTFQMILMMSWSGSGSTRAAAPSLVLLDPDNEVTKILWNAGKYLPRLESSET